MQSRSIPHELGARWVAYQQAHGLHLEPITPVERSKHMHFRVDYFTNGTWQRWRYYASHDAACREADRIRLELGFATEIVPCA